MSRLSNSQSSRPSFFSSDNFPLGSLRRLSCGFSGFTYAPCSLVCPFVSSGAPVPSAAASSVRCLSVAGGARSGKGSFRKSRKYRGSRVSSGVTGFSSPAWLDSLTTSAGGSERPLWLLVETPEFRYDVGEGGEGGACDRALASTGLEGPIGPGGGRDAVLSPGGGDRLELRRDESCRDVNSLRLCLESSATRSSMISENTRTLS